MKESTKKDVIDKIKRDGFDVFEEEMIECLLKHLNLDGLFFWLSHGIKNRAADKLEKSNIIKNKRYFKSLGFVRLCDLFFNNRNVYYCGKELTIDELRKRRLVERLAGL